MTDIVTALFGSPARVKLLRLFLFNPNQPFTVVDAATRARVQTAVTRREIALYVRVGLLVNATPRAKEGKFAVRERAPHLALLQNLLLETTISHDDVAKRLLKAGPVKFIALGGVFVAEWGARLDVLMVGDKVDDRKLRLQMKTLEADLGRELRYTVLSTQDFAYRMSMNDRLVRDVFDYPHHVVLDALNTGIK